MLITVRCFSCGNPVAEYFDAYNEKISSVEQGGKGDSPAKALDDLGLTRICCRRMILGNVQLVDEILPYQRF